MDISCLNKVLATTKGKLALGLGLTLALVLLYLAVYWGGYRHGYGTAKAAGDAKYNALKASQEHANSLASDEARKVLDAEIIRRDGLARDLAVARATIAAKSGAITERRIADVSRSVTPAADGRCRFSVGWVRLYNEAAGFGDGDSTGSAASPRADGAAGGVQAAAGGQLPSGVTEEDVLITHRDNMRVCQDIKARYLGLVKWARGLPQTVNATEAR